MKCLSKGWWPGHSTAGDKSELADKEALKLRSQREARWLIESLGSESM